MSQAKHHLGNCSKFLSEFKVPSLRDDESPPGLFLSAGVALVGHEVLAFRVSGSQLQNALFRCDMRDHFAYKWCSVQTTVDPLPDNHRKPFHGRGTESIGLTFVHRDKLYTFVKNSINTVLGFRLDLVIQEVWENVVLRGVKSRYLPWTGAYHEEREHAYFSYGQRVYELDVESSILRSRKTTGENPGRRDDHACCISPRTFFVMGGSRQRDLNAFALDLETYTWAKIESTGQRMRYRFTASYINGRIFVMGGTNAANTLDTFDLLHDRWVNIYATDRSTDSTSKLRLQGSLYDGTERHQAVITRDKLLIVGGCGSMFENFGILSISPSRY